MVESNSIGKSVALAALQERQHKHPPRYPLNSKGNDRVQALLGLLKLPDVLRAKIDQGQIAVGEIGDFKPDARTFQIGDSGFLVTLNSGIMDFYYAVGRALAGVTVTWSGGAPENRPVLTVPATAELVADVFKQWRKFCQPKLWDIVWREKRIEHAAFAITPKAHDIAEKLVTSAELFLLSHELGHTMLDLKLIEFTLENEEMRADAAGVRLYLQSATDIWGVRMALMGAAFAVRVTSGLERAGVKFSREYPPAADRLRGVLKAIGKECPSAQFFDEAATVMVAIMQLMDDVDDLIKRGGSERDFALWEVEVQMIAILLAVADKSNQPEAFLKMWDYELARRPTDEMREVAEKLLRYYPAVPGPNGYIDPQIRAAMHNVLKNLINGMPAPAKLPFEMAFRQ